MPFFPQCVVNDDHVARLLVNLHCVLESSYNQLERDVHVRNALGALIARHADNRPFSLLNTGPRIGALCSVCAAISKHITAIILRWTTWRGVAGFSPYHLARLFHDETGLPPHTYLTQLRINRAKQRLQAGDPIADVAAATGFSDQSHLTRRFKRIVGVTPGQFVTSIG